MIPKKKIHDLHSELVSLGNKDTILNKFQVHGWLKEIERAESDGSADDLAISTISKLIVYTLAWDTASLEKTYFESKDYFIDYPQVFGAFLVSVNRLYYYSDEIESEVMKGWKRHSSVISVLESCLKHFVQIGRII